jgi:3-oxoacyl-[acyl-carrier protein] reductase
LPQPSAIVTGGSRGIGRAIATELAKTHRVIATYRGRRDAAELLRAETGCEIRQCDVSRREDRDALIAFARERFANLDLLVNNAGMAPRERRDLLETTEESFDELIATNLKGPHFLTQQAARWMLPEEPAGRGDGRIVFVTSISSYTASVNRGEYCISKAGLSMSVALYAQRLAAVGIKVFEIRPGIVRTDMIAKVEQLYDEKIAAGLLPQLRMGEGSDIAKAVRAIADGLLDYSTGQVLNVDGGFSLRSL